MYDLDAIMRAMNILADDLEMVVSMDRNYSNRINSTSAKSRALRDQNGDVVISMQDMHGLVRL